MEVLETVGEMREWNGHKSSERDMLLDLCIRNENENESSCHNARLLVLPIHFLQRYMFPWSRGVQLACPVFPVVEHKLSPS